MTVVTSIDALVKHWEDKSTGIVATAYEYDDGTIKINDNQPCHRSFRPSYTDHTGYSYGGYGIKPVSQMKAAIVKLSYLAPNGYCGGGGGVEEFDTKYDKIVEAWYDFLLSKDGPWRGLDREIYIDSKGKYRALRIPDVDKQEFQYWLHMCFASRAAPQRQNAVRLWYDLIETHGFHPTEAFFIISGLMYNSDKKSIQFNPIAYDWPFKGYNDRRADFKRLWRGTPNIKVKGYITGGQHYGEPNDIWVVDNPNDALNFVEHLQTGQSSYAGSFGGYRKQYVRTANLVDDLPTASKCFEMLKKERELWPR